MKASVLLISYNQERYIKECVESILMQDTSFDVEIIVADDYSTDETLKIITNLLSVNKFPYKVLNSGKNIGMHQNYRRGFEACSGDYIAIIEGDDYWDDPMRLNKHIVFLDKNPNCVLSFNRLKIHQQEKNRLILQEWNHQKDVEFITTSMMASKNRIGNLSACVLRKSVLQKLPPELYELGFADWMLGMALGEHGTLARLKEPMSVYRVHEKGIWSGSLKVEKYSKLINTIIPKYDAYLGYKYHNEFEIFKERLEIRLKQESSLKYKILSMTPLFIKKTLSYILPEFIKAPLRNII